MKSTNSLIIECATETCETLLTIRRDDYIPQTPWLCPKCQHDIDELQAEEMARYYGQDIDGQDVKERWLDEQRRIAAHRADAVRFVEAAIKTTGATMKEAIDSFNTTKHN